MSTIELTRFKAAREAELLAARPEMLADLAAIDTHVPAEAGTHFGG